MQRRAHQKAGHRHVVGGVVPRPLDQPHTGGAGGGHTGKEICIEPVEVGVDLHHPIMARGGDACAHCMAHAGLSL